MNVFYLFLIFSENNGVSVLRELVPGLRELVRKSSRAEPEEIPKICQLRFRTLWKHRSKCTLEY